MGDHRGTPNHVVQTTDQREAEVILVGDFNSVTQSQTIQKLSERGAAQLCPSLWRDGHRNSAMFALLRYSTAWGFVFLFHGVQACPF